MKTSLRAAALSACLIVFAFGGAAFAGEPMQAMETYVNKVLEVLRDPQYTGEKGKTKQREVLRTLGEKIFDFELLSRFTLGRNWNSLNEAQQRRFVDLYSRLLEKTYMDRIQDYKNEKVRFVDENHFGRKAEVQTEVLASDKIIPIDYRMVEDSSGDWRIYDVLVEGVSLAKNYRAQFTDILSDRSVEEMLTILKDKVARQKSEDAAKDS